MAIKPEKNTLNLQKKCGQEAFIVFLCSTTIFFTNFFKITIQEMANILCIETSTDVCSVALTCDGEVLEHHENYEGQNHARVLSSFIESVMKYATSREIKLDAVAVSLGPGSYTGLRIGLSEAKGLCFGLDVPLIGIHTLKLLAVELMFAHFFEEEVYFAPMIDARRKEVYTAVYDPMLREVMPAQPLILDENSYADVLAKHKVAFFGNGSDKARDIIHHPNALFFEGVKPVALTMLALAEKAVRENDFIDVAYSTPIYLKEYQATVPKNKI